jgi:hypothetical protein
MWSVDGTYKMFFFFCGFEDSSLFKNLFERKCNDILERCSENMYVIENEDCEPVV